MKSGGPSRTAIMAAMGRALHRQGPLPRILDDWLAADLAGDEGRAILDGMRANVAPARLTAFQAWTAARARFVEDFALAAAADGIGQYVLLGAGIDSFAYRHPEVADRLTIYEVDHALSQEWKRHRLAELEIPIPGNVVYVAIDFETESLRDGLDAAGFASTQPAVVSWIGVTMYLHRAAVDATLSSVARLAAGTRLVLSFDQPPAALDERGRQLLADVSGTAARFGEPFISLFRQDEIEHLLAGHGFEDITHFGAADAQRRYFGEADAGMPDVQRLATAVVAATAAATSR